jgi:hypothetical protein
VAHAARRHPHLDLVGSRWRQLDIGDLERRSDLGEDRCPQPGTSAAFTAPDRTWAVPRPPAERPAIGARAGGEAAAETAGGGAGAPAAVCWPNQWRTGMGPRPGGEAAAVSVVLVSTIATAADQPLP